MAWIFERKGGRLPITITGAEQDAYSGRWHLVDDERIEWYRKESWDEDGKLAFAMPDMCRPQAILLTQEEFDSIVAGEKKEETTMKRYEIIRKEGRKMIRDNETGLFFAGYNFMGGAEWREEISPDCILAQYEDADQIVADLEAADEPAPAPAEPEKRINAGYEIIRAIEIYDGVEIVIGKHPTAPSPYVVWDCVNGDDYNNGGYCLSFRQAMGILAERITDRYDWLPMEA